MKQSSWEVHATRLANAPSDEAVFEVYDGLIKELSIKTEVQPRVIFARDTRLQLKVELTSRLSTMTFYSQTYSIIRYNPTTACILFNSGR